MDVCASQKERKGSQSCQSQDLIGSAKECGPHPEDQAELLEGFKEGRSIWGRYCAHPLERSKFTCRGTVRRPAEEWKEAVAVAFVKSGLGTIPLGEYDKMEGWTVPVCWVQKGRRGWTKHSIGSPSF